MSFSFGMPQFKIGRFPLIVRRSMDFEIIGAFCKFDDLGDALWVTVTLKYEMDSFS